MQNGRTDVDELEELTPGLMGQVGEAPDFSKADGWEPVSAEQAPFAVKGAGLVVTGELVGRFKRKDVGIGRKGSPWFYQIRLSHPAVGVKGSKVKGTIEQVVVPAGELISVDESKSMEELKYLTDSGGKYLVWLRWNGKVTLGDGNTFWDVQKRHKVLKAPPKAAASEHGEEHQDGADIIK